jgi:hypothetical protein
MLTSRIRRFVLTAALAVMPMQGAAAILSVLLCHGDGDAQSHAAHDQSAHGHGSQHDGHHDGQQDKGDSKENPGLHFCCNLTVSLPAIVTVPSVTPDFPIRALAPDSLHDLFIPDRPQRPPLA